MKLLTDRSLEPVLVFLVQEGVLFPFWSLRHGAHPTRAGSQDTSNGKGRRLVCNRTGHSLYMALRFVRPRWHERSNTQVLVHESILTFCSFAPCHLQILILRPAACTGFEEAAREWSEYDAPRYSLVRFRSRFVPYSFQIRSRFVRPSAYTIMGFQHPSISVRHQHRQTLWSATQPHLVNNQYFEYKFIK